MYRALNLTRFFFSIEDHCQPQNIVDILGSRSACSPKRSRRHEDQPTAPLCNSCG